MSSSKKLLLLKIALINLGIYTSASAEVFVKTLPQEKIDSLLTSVSVAEHLSSSHVLALLVESDQ